MNSNLTVHPFKVLIVDDEPDFLEVLRDYLQTQPADVEQASNGDEALEMIKRTSFDVVITDLNMPTMNGRELLKKAHELKLNPEPIFLVATGQLSPEDNLTLEELSKWCQGVLFKPFEASELNELLLEQLGRKPKAA